MFPSHVSGQHANQQPLLGQGVKAYLVDVFVYSFDVPGYVSLLQQGLSNLLNLHRMNYQRAACKVCRVQAIRARAELLTNEMKGPSLLEIINSCRTLMSPEYTDAARPFVDFTLKGTFS